MAQNECPDGIRFERALCKENPATNIQGYPPEIAKNATVLTLLQREHSLSTSEKGNGCLMRDAERQTGTKTSGDRNFTINLRKRE